MPDATLKDLFGAELLMRYDASDASRLFTDTAGTIAATNGAEVKCWKPTADAAFNVNLTNANGPQYQANYASSGYAALVFDGVNDVLLNAATGLSSGQRASVLLVHTWIGPAGTSWCRGNSTAWLRGYHANTTSDGMQQPSAIFSNTVPSGRRVMASVAGSGQSQIDILGFSSGDRTNFASGISGALTIGALNTGSLSQFGNFALHEILVIGSNCEWGQVLRGAALLRSKWGITDPNAVPQQPATGFPLTRLVN